MIKAINFIWMILLTLPLCMAQKGDVLVKGGTVLTITQGIKEQTDVLVLN